MEGERLGHVRTVLMAVDVETVDDGEGHVAGKLGFIGGVEDEGVGVAHAAVDGVVVADGGDHDS